MTGATCQEKWEKFLCSQVFYFEKKAQSQDRYFTPRLHLLEIYRKMRNPIYFGEILLLIEVDFYSDPSCSLNYQSPASRLFTNCF